VVTEEKKLFVLQLFFSPVFSSFKLFQEIFGLPLHHWFLRGNPGVCHAMAGTGFM
jgi:hypothetical protein